MLPALRKQDAFVEMNRRVYCLQLPATLRVSVVNDLQTIFDNTCKLPTFLYDAPVPHHGVQCRLICY